jgi:acetyl-CoA carboxylase biotin carboxylase subunit
MFNKVLIANRGEIAVRIIRACHELNLKTVAVYSDVDRSALHVRYADEAYYLGPAPARDSYLRGDLLIDIAKRSGAGAIHPGYGFLAERDDFALAVQDAGLVFIGPKPSAIAAMGDKGVARTTVTSAGVHVVPGTEGEGALTDDELIAIAPEIGFPLLIKATAGGGGKGMRQVDSAETLLDLIQAARREAESSFGDGNVYFEKLLVNARHIEFQILADGHGNVIHLGERECSLQRRHQKLLEESPSPLLDQDLRRRMGEVACTAARAVDYVNAGTIEFLVDTDQNFYFLEMNTRLQVEHPVTEIVTGIDIVKEQILIAQGARLRFKQEDIHQKGWAIECRINAEDPYNNFMPSTGTLLEVSPPTGPGVRVDSGVFSGVMISPYYDSLISKLICWGENRTDAITRMRRALMEYVIVGVTTNIPFHQRIMDSHHFVTGQFDTRFVEERFSMDEAENDLESIPHIAATLAALAMHRKTHRVAKVTSEEKRPGHSWKWAGRMDRLSD